MSLKSPELLRRYLTGKLNNPSSLTGKSREQARVYYKNHLKRCDLREIDQAKLFLSREEMLQSLFSSKFISKDNCLPAAEHLMLDGETERKRLKGWLLALPDEHHIIASWLEWVKYFNFAADSEFRQRLTAIASRNYGRGPDSPSNIALSLLAKG